MRLRTRRIIIAISLVVITPIAVLLIYALHEDWEGTLIALYILGWLALSVALPIGAIVLSIGVIVVVVVKRLLRKPPHTP